MNKSFWEGAEPAREKLHVHHLYTEDGLVNPDLWSRRIIIWGAGNDGIKLYKRVKEANRSVSLFCDSNEALYAGGVFGIPVISYRELDQYEGYNLALAFHKYPEVLDKIPSAMQGNVFADYLFEHRGDGTCIVCGNHEVTYDRAHFAPFLKERMFLGQEKETRLVHCLHCGTFYSEYRPGETEMERLYSKYRDEAYEAQRKRHERNYSNEIAFYKEGRENRHKAVERFLMPYVREACNSKKILDYGGDRGQFIHDFFMDMECYVYDISLNETMDGVIPLRTMDEVKKMEWDVILCMMLLEHVSDPMETMGQLVGLMHESTLLYVEVPFQTYMHQYSDVEINEHVNFFTEMSMVVAAEKFGLDIVSMKTETEKYDLDVKNMETDSERVIRVLFQKQ